MISATKVLHISMLNMSMLIMSVLIILPAAEVTGSEQALAMSLIGEVKDARMIQSGRPSTLVRP